MGLLGETEGGGVMAGKPNTMIRDAMYDNHMAQWQLAELLDVSESTIWRMLRKEMPDKEQSRIVWIINHPDEYRRVIGTEGK